MRITATKTKNDTIYYLTKSVRVGKKSTSIRVEKLGRHSDLIKLHDDPLAYLDEYAKKMTENDKKGSLSYQFEEKIGTYLANDDDVSSQNTLNIGYFFLQSIYDRLKLKDFFKGITQDSKIEYDPNLVTRFLTFSRILDPKSKKGTFDNFNTYYEKPAIKLQDIYKTLDLIYDNLDSFQTHLYKNSLNVISRDTSVLYYDCTNYFFEIETEDNLRKYGKSKENRPNPIVQMGLFMDSNGLPLCFSINPGNTSEQKTAIPLEMKIVKDFELSKFIYCADAGLGSNDIRLFNTFSNRSFIITQSIKKMKKELQDYFLEDFGWTSVTTGLKTSLSSIDASSEDLFYKERWINNPIDLGISKTSSNKKVDFSQRIIVTYSKKYDLYQQTIRERQINRAESLINNNYRDTINQNDVKRFIKSTFITDDGEIAGNKIHQLNVARIDEERKYDGFYAIATTLEDDAKEIIQINSRRWEIEECFRIMKTNFKSRPVYHYKDTRIISHFAICFNALLVYRLLEKKLNNTYSINEIIHQLKIMNVDPLNNVIYKSLYSGSKLCDILNKTFEMNLNRKNYLNTTLNKELKKIN